MKTIVSAALKEVIILAIALLLVMALGLITEHYSGSKISKTIEVELNN